MTTSGSVTQEPDCHLLTYKDYAVEMMGYRGLEHGGRGFGCSASHRFYGENFAGRGGGLPASKIGRAHV